MIRGFNTSTNHDFLSPLLFLIEQILIRIGEIEDKIESENNPKDDKIEKLEEENEELKEKLGKIKDALRE